MSNRDLFEIAYLKEIGDEALHWYVKEHRKDDDLYLFENQALTGCTNSAWWGWRAGQATMNVTAEGEPHVLH